MAYSDVMLNSNGDKPYKNADTSLNIRNDYGIHDMLKKTTCWYTDVLLGFLHPG
jgi:hypothetical protein